MTEIAPYIHSGKPCDVSWPKTIQRVRWMRRNLNPELVTFTAGSDIVANSHDYLLITYRDGVKLVLDPTAMYFGWTRRLHTRKEYEKQLATYTLVPEPANVVEEIRHLDEGDWLVRLTREEIEQCVDGSETRNSSGGLADADLPEMLADRVQTKVSEVLEMLKQLKIGNDLRDDDSELHNRRAFESELEIMGREILSCPLTAIDDQMVARLRKAGFYQCMTGESSFN